MTLSQKLEFEVEINAPSSKFFEMFHMKPYLLPKASPTNIQSCKLAKGEWGKVGAIVHFIYFHAERSWSAKELVEAIDEKNNSIIFKVEEGSDKLEYYKNFKTTIQSVSKEKGSLVHWTLEYEKTEEKNSENLQHSLMELFIALSKDIDAHLMEIESNKETLVAA